jgi:hypothetical protein
MYDPRCYDLAEYFLSDYPNATEEEKRELALQIMNVCEDFLVLFDGRDEGPA